MQGFIFVGVDSAAKVGGIQLGCVGLTSLQVSVGIAANGVCGDVLF